MNYINDNMRVEGYVEALKFKTTDPTGDKVLVDNGLTFNINRLENYFGTCDTAVSTATKIVVLDDDTGFALEDGVHLSVVFNNGNTASGTVTISTDNGVTYKPLYYNDGTAVSGSMTAGTYSLVFHNNTWVMLNGNASSGGGSNTDISYANGTLSKTVNGTTSNVVTADNIVKDGLTVGTATGSGNVISEISKNASTGELELIKGVTAITDVVYNTNTKALQKTVGGTTTNIVTTEDLLYTYGEVRMHRPVYVNPAGLSTLGSLDALFIDQCPAIFLEDETLYDTIIVTPFYNLGTQVLDFSKITAYADDIHKRLSLNRIHIYIMYSKSGLTIIGAVVNNPLTVSGSHSDPGVVIDNTCKLECYFNIDYGYWFVEVTSMGFVKGSKLFLSDYKEIIEVK